MKKYTEEFLLEELRRFERENGRVPKQRDLCSKNGYISSRTYCDYFGSYNRALELSGLKLNRFVGYTDEFLISEMKRFVEETGRNPTHDDFMNNPDYPSAPTYVTHFGSWNQSLEKCGLNTNRCYNRDPEFLISEIERFTRENGRTPYCRDMTNGYPSMNLYVDVFGSWNNVLAKCGIDPYTNRVYDKDFLLLELLRFTDEFDKVPTTRDLDGIVGYPSSRTYKTWFGTYNSALLEAGLDIYTCHDFTRESLIEDLQTFAEELGRSPYAEEMTRSNGYCSSSVYMRIWGDWNSALREAGLDVNKVRNYDYTSNLICSVCGERIYDDAHTKNNKLICSTCRLREWRKENPDKYREQRSKRRGYGFTPLNKKSECHDAHHLHIEDRNDFVVYIPTFMHQLYGHQQAFPDTMDTVNSIALDYFVQEDLYNSLYLEGEP